MRTIVRVAVLLAALGVTSGAGAANKPEEHVRLTYLKATLALSPGVFAHTNLLEDEDDIFFKDHKNNDLFITLRWADACAEWAKAWKDSPKATVPSLPPSGWYPQLYRVKDDDLIMACMDTKSGKGIEAEITAEPSELSDSDVSRISEVLNSLARQLGR